MLFRSVSIVIAQLTSGTTLMHARLSEYLTPFSLGFQLMPKGVMDPATDQGRAMLDGLVTGQALTISYQNDFLLMTYMSLLCLPLVLLFRKDTTSAKAVRR